MHSRLRNGLLWTMLGLGVVALALLWTAARPAAAHPATPVAPLAPPTLGTTADWLPGRVLVKPYPSGAAILDGGLLHGGALWPGLNGLLAGFHLIPVGDLAPDSGVYALQGAPSLDVAAAVRALRASGQVAYAEPDYV